MNLLNRKSHFGTLNENEVAEKSENESDISSEKLLTTNRNNFKMSQEVKHSNPFTF